MLSITKTKTKRKQLIVGLITGCFVWSTFYSVAASAGIPERIHNTTSNHGKFAAKPPRKNTKSGFGLGKVNTSSKYKISPARASSNTASDTSLREATDHPVIIENGNKVLPETDITTRGEMPLTLTRNYDKAWPITSGSFGGRWSSNLDYRLIFNYSNGSSCSYTPGVASAVCSTASISTITNNRPSGEQIIYTNNNGIWTTSASSVLPKITNIGSQWVLTNSDNSVETYSNIGAIQSVLDAYGVGWAYNYSAFLLTSMRHSSGRYFLFSWLSNKVQSVTDSNSGVYQYTYNPNGYLASVGSPDGVSETYVYENSSLPDALTGVYFNGNRYSEFSYNADGTVNSSGLVNGIENDTFSYVPDSGSGTKSTTVTNATGAKATYTYQKIAGNYLLISVAKSNIDNISNSAAEFTYDSNGYLSSVSDFVGNVTLSRYNSSGFLIAQKQGSGTDETTLSYTWDTVNNRIASILVFPAGSPFFNNGTGSAIENITYSYYPSSSPAANRIQSIIKTNLSNSGVFNQSQTDSYSYNIGSNNLPLSTIITPHGLGSITTTYDTLGDIVEVTNSENQSSVFSSYNGLGEPGLITNVNNVSTSYTYDARGRTTYTRQLSNQQQQINYYIYNATGQLLQQVQTPSYQTTNYAYDNAGRLISTDDNIGDSVNYSYNSLSKPIRISYNLNGVTSTAVSYTYDQAGNQTSQQENNGQSYAYAYDGNGNVISTNDMQGRLYRYTYNSYGKTTSQTDPLGQVARLNYDSNGFVISLLDFKGLTTSYTYDGLENLVKLVSPDTGTTNVINSAAALPISIQYNNNSYESRSYDDLGRLVSRNSAGNIESFVFDNCLNGVGKLCSVVNSKESVSYQYDINGNIVKQSNSSNGGAYTASTAWTYDASNRMLNVIYPDGKEVLYSYDQANRVTSVQIEGLTSTNVVADGFQYLPNGSVRSFVYGDGEARTLNYDLDGRITAITSGAVESLSFAYDNSDQIISVIDNVQTGQTLSISHDLLKRIDSIASVSGNFNWNYDPNGTRTQQVDSSGVGTYYIDANSNRLNGATGSVGNDYFYDQVGNLTSVLGTSPLSIEYDAYFRPIYVSGPSNILQTDITPLPVAAPSQTSVNKTTTYDYNPLGQRGMKVSSDLATWFVYSSTGQLYSEHNGLFAASTNSAIIKSSTEVNTVSSKIDTDYIWANGQIIAIIKDGIVLYVHNDQLGRPTAITGVNKDLLWQAKNRTFDRTVGRDLIGGYNIEFPGQYYDEESGLYYNNNRYYDPSIGRYISSDPLGVTQGVNTYSYVRNNPVSNTDPLGLGDFPSMGNLVDVAGLTAAGGAGAGTAYGISTGAALGDVAITAGVGTGFGGIFVLGYLGGAVINYVFVPDDLGSQIYDALQNSVAPPDPDYDGGSGTMGFEGGSGDGSSLSVIDDQDIITGSGGGNGGSGIGCLGCDQLNIVQD